MKPTIKIIFYIVLTVFATGCSKNDTENISGNDILIDIEAPRINEWSMPDDVGTRNSEINTAEQKRRRWSGYGSKDAARF
ncbi:MAG: hypothetical protein LUE99_08690 [Bacteroides sp.]|nr:hypothetical protein [Bacteroides sp.]